MTQPLVSTINFTVTVPVNIISNRQNRQGQPEVRQGNVTFQFGPFFAVGPATFVIPGAESLLESLNQNGGFSNVQLGGRTFEAWVNELFQQHQPRGTPPASRKVIESLPIIRIEQQHIEQRLECPICKELFYATVESLVVQLPCRHLFHKECIVPWLQQHNTCPVCRYELETDDPQYEAQRRMRQQQQQQRAGNSVASTQPRCAMERITGEDCALLADHSFQTLRCGCVFHTECLTSALRVQHYSGDPQQPFKCPSCLKQTSIQQPMEVDWKRVVYIVYIANKNIYYWYKDSCEVTSNWRESLKCKNSIKCDAEELNGQGRIID